MKTWMLYIGAVLLGLASSLLFQTWESYQPILQLLVPLMKEISLFILFPVVLTLYSAGSASLLRHRNASLLYVSTLFWALSTTLILTFAASYAVYFIPEGFLALPAVASSGGVQVQIPTYESIKNLIVSDNAFSQLTVTSTHLLPMIVVSIIVGYSIKPNYEAIRPVYVVANSFAEAILRLSKVTTLLFAVPVFVLSAHFFSSVQLMALIVEAAALAGLYGLITILVLFALLPLIWGLYTGFHRGNPYSVIFRGFSALISSFFFQSTIESTMALIALSQQNNRVKKRIAGTSIPLFSIFGKGGSALLASVTVIVILTGTDMELNVLFIALIALFSAFVSLVSSFAIRTEVVFIMLTAYMGIGNSELSVPSAIIILLPLIQGLASLINAAIALLGAAYSSRIISADDIPEHAQTL